MTAQDAEKDTIRSKPEAMANTISGKVECIVCEMSTLVSLMTDK
jgi:hypothetical protein